uniref:Uncharacterized protein n=1 Tax=Anguilla anguilla TaxID=7936 RepID=A0A0E9U7U6_ANGAN
MFYYSWYCVIWQQFPSDLNSEIRSMKPPF